MRLIKNVLKSIDKLLFPDFYNGKDEYRELLKQEITGAGESLLDIGCGGHSPASVGFAGLKRTVGIDGFDKAIEGSKRLGLHHEYKLMNVLDTAKEFPPQSFDIVVALDLLEHLEPADGEKFLGEIEAIAKNKVIIFTPNGFVNQNEYDGNALQIHRAGWTVAQMRERGYRVMGLNGLKYLRGEEAHPKFRPHWFWQRILHLTQPFVRRFPRFAYQMLAVRDLRGEK